MSDPPSPATYRVAYFDGQVATLPNVLLNPHRRRHILGSGSSATDKDTTRRIQAWHYAFAAGSDGPTPLHFLAVDHGAEAGTTKHDMSPIADRRTSNTPPPAVHAIDHAEQREKGLEVLHLPSPRSDTASWRPHVYLKDESHRLSLPSFKILGAAWAIHRLLCAQQDRDPFSLSSGQDHTLPHDTAPNTAPAAAGGVHLIAASAGNWGRAVAHAARRLGVRAEILLPRTTEGATRDMIAAEDAGTGLVSVEVLGTDYDEAVVEARQRAQQRSQQARDDDGAARGSRREVVMDTSWPGYEEFPAWVVQGYGAMLVETEEQLARLGRRVGVVLVSVGVGSWAQAVVQRYMHREEVVVVTIEPERAACLAAALWRGKQDVGVRTSRTIMNGMNCGVVSRIAWEGLRDRVDIALAVGEEEVHRKTVLLGQAGYDVGPCGAATLVGLEKLWRERPETVAGLDEDAVVVVFSTEGRRAYDNSDTAHEE